MAWIRDQYEHPLERKHSLDEVIGWFDENDIAYLGSIPSPNLKFVKVSEMGGSKGTYFQRVCSQLFMLFSNSGSEGGLCIVVGKRKPQKIKGN